MMIKEAERDAVGARFSHKVDLQDFLDAVSTVLKYLYLFCSNHGPHVWLACHEVWCAKQDERFRAVVHNIQYFGVWEKETLKPKS